MKKIMIADDEPGIVEMIKGYFEMSGYEVITAQDGTSALEKISQRPDLILLDINMPGMDGLEVCRLVREHVTCPVIFLTARLENGDKIAGFGAGADDYIVKPFDIDVLGAQVEAHLRREERRTGAVGRPFFRRADRGLFRTQGDGGRRTRAFIPAGIRYRGASVPQ